MGVRQRGLMGPPAPDLCRRPQIKHPLPNLYPTFTLLLTKPEPPHLTTVNRNGISTIQVPLPRVGVYWVVEIKKKIKTLLMSKRPSTLLCPLLGHRKRVEGGLLCPTVRLRPPTVTVNYSVCWNDVGSREVFITGKESFNDKVLT